MKIAIWLLSIGVCLLAGCGESERHLADSGSGDVIRRAQLVGSENIQLKRQVAELEKQIEALNAQLEQEKETRLTNQRQMGEGYMKLMEMLTECRRRLRAAGVQADEGAGQ